MIYTKVVTVTWQMIERKNMKRRKNIESYVVKFLILHFIAKNMSVIMRYK